ncbi:hypothetical protein [uncultured Erythrobacter sp.]|uniref:hypothetical protein n=1 Tax=uncultured Erythrobacter sp. TaxID=263913 RepID=UPI002614F83E|nr:hypothetical protein [uncultured Erythrobacter sp.]
MAKPEDITPSKRVGAGSALACVTTALVFGLWRVAATFDSATGLQGWAWLLFEGAFLLFTLPVFALLFCFLGAFLVHKGSGARSLSILGSVAIVLVFGFVLMGIGLIGIEEAGPLSSAPVSLGMLAIAGAVGGYFGHAGWFPAHRRAA